MRIYTDLNDVDLYKPMVMEAYGTHPRRAEVGEVKLPWFWLWNGLGPVNGGFREINRSGIPSVVDYAIEYLYDFPNRRFDSSPVRAYNTVYLTTEMIGGYNVTRRDFYQAGEPVIELLLEVTSPEYN